MSRTNMLTKLLAVGIMLSNGLASGNSKLFFAIAGCVSEDGTLAEAILMGTDAASGWDLDEPEDGNPTA